jgi:thiol-disulfide isomerase/thioredoxin
MPHVCIPNIRVTGVSFCVGCGPCKALAPILEKIVTELGGVIKLLKVHAVYQWTSLVRTMMRFSVFAD